MNYLKKNKIAISIFSFILFLIILVPQAMGDNKSYYSGDAINYKGNLVVGSVNMGYLELFQLQGDSLVEKSRVYSTEARLFGNDSFYDLLFDVDGNGLYVYLTDGRSLQKYDISNLSDPVLVKTIKDNSWDWYMGIEKFGNRFATIGTKEIKYWNRDLEVVDAYKITNDNHVNVAFSSDGKYIFSLEKGEIKIFDTFTRDVVSVKSIYSESNHFRKMYVDNFSKNLYIVDDHSIKKFNYTDNSRFHVQEFVHISDLGYDVFGNDDRGYVYFSDGVGIVKTSTETMDPIDYVFTLSLGEAGGWAMGLKAVEAQGEKVVIFNNSAILVLDENLDLITYKKSVEELKKNQREPLYLKLDKYSVVIGDSIEVSGGGFFSNEDLVVKILNKKFTTKADSRGRFNVDIIVPQAYQIDRTDVKVDGLESGLIYSTAISILK